MPIRYKLSDEFFVTDAQGKQKVNIRRLVTHRQNKIEYMLLCWFLINQTIDWTVKQFSSKKHPVIESAVNKLVQSGTLLIIQEENKND